MEYAKAICCCRTVKQSKKLEDGDGAVASFAITFEPPNVRIHDSKGVTTCFFGVGFRKCHEIAFANIAGVSFTQVTAEEDERERVAFDVFHQCLEFLRRAAHAEGSEQVHAGVAGQAQQFHLRRSGLPERAQVRQRIAGGDEAQAVAGGGEAFKQRGDALVLELVGRGRGGRVLQRLETVEDEQGVPLADDGGEALAFLERTGGAGSEGFVRVVAEEGEGFLEKQVGTRGHLLARALAVEAPGKGGVAAGPVLRGEFDGPLGDEGSFAFAARSVSSSSRPMRSAGAYLKMREMSA